MVTSPAATLADEEREARVLRKRSLSHNQNITSRRGAIMRTRVPAPRKDDLTLQQFKIFPHQQTDRWSGRLLTGNLIAKCTIFPFSLRITIAPMSPPVPAVSTGQCKMSQRDPVHCALSTVQALESRQNGWSGLIIQGEKLSAMV